MRNFWLNRTVDATGVSGTGHVAQGAVFDNGKVALVWLTPTSSTVIYDSIEDVTTIHGHGGSTVVEFMPDLTDLLKEIQVLEDDITSIAGDLDARDRELSFLENDYNDMKFRMDGLDK